jgi:hypothetical protein
MRQAIGRIYDDVETGLWACLIAALIFFVVLFVPHASELRARAEGVRAQEIAAENRQLCEQLGKLSGTHEHITCILDMQAFRASVERQIAAAQFF